MEIHHIRKCIGAWMLIAGGYAHALPPIDPDTGSGVTPGQTRALECAGQASVSFTATPASIDLGGSSTLRWSVKLPSNCGMLTRVTLGGQNVPFSGSMTVQPMSNATYNLNLPIPGGTAFLGTASIRVILPPEVSIDGSTPAWRALLLQALREEGKIIRLSNSVDMDLSHLEKIPIAGGVRVIGGRSPLRRGARLFTTTYPNPLFEVAADNVRLSGFRVQGASYSENAGYARGLIINSKTNVEVSNMEWSGFGTAAIYVADNVTDAAGNPLDRITRMNAGTVHIHDNYIHHNQHLDGNGYGVQTGYGGYALIERNVFDYNRHAIESDGRRGSGYFALHNLVLKNGGQHCAWNVGSLGMICWHTHQFDVHGQESCFGKGEFSCGLAGEYYEYRGNTLLYTAGTAIKIRGNPEVGALATGNVFAHTSRGEAIAQNGAPGAGDNVTKPIDVRSDNVFGYDGSGQTGSCDLDGDGRADTFMATGVTWWYASNVTGYWTYLNTAPERLNQISLGDFDGDNVCDAAVTRNGQWIVFSGGKPASRFQSVMGVADRASALRR